ncbi:DUF4338 domain-containing protein, partial [Candidatus Saganbacteria bacterium]|nr:DUF4338 domain-containing protein [Candidatus Saganbacteria bacterium]
SVKQVPPDWQKQYGQRLCLMETFVEKERFQGTCYKAANWIYVGETKGFSKRGSLYYQHKNIKTVYLYPLCKDFKEKLPEQIDEIKEIHPEQCSHCGSYHVEEYEGKTEEHIQEDIVIPAEKEQLLSFIRSP